MRRSVRGCRTPGRLLSGPGHPSFAAIYQEIGTASCAAMPLSPSPHLSVAERGFFVSMSAENQIRNLRIAFENGKLTRDLYARNLLRLLGLAEHPTAQKVAAAFIVGRIDQTLLARNLGNLRPAPGPTAPDPLDLPPPP